MIILAPDIRPGRRHYRPEPPAARRQVSYRCSGNHEFAVVLSAEAEPPATQDCRCGASAHRAGSASVVMPGSSSVVAADSDHERRMGQLRGRRSPAELEQILADRLAELAAMRKAGRTRP